MAYYPPSGHAAPAPYAPVAGAAYGMPNQLWEFEFRCSGLDRKDIFSKSDPFLQLSCSLAPAKHNAMIGQQKHKKTYKRNISSKAKRSWVMVHKTETVMDNQHPSFRKFTLDINHLCHGNIDQAVLLEVYDWDKSGGHDLIGRAIVSLRSMQVNNEVVLYNPKRVGVTNRAGLVQVLACRPVVGVAVAPQPAVAAAVTTTTTYQGAHPAAPAPAAYSQTTVQYGAAPTAYPGYPPAAPGYPPSYGAYPGYGYAPPPGAYPPPGGYPPYGY